MIAETGSDTGLAQTALLMRLSKERTKMEFITGNKYDCGELGTLTLKSIFVNVFGEIVFRMTCENATVDFIAGKDNELIAKFRPA